MNPRTLDALVSLLGDLLITAVVLFGVKRGTVPPELGAAALGYAFHAVVPPLGRSPLAQVLIWSRRRSRRADR